MAMKRQLLAIYVIKLQFMSIAGRKQWCLFPPCTPKSILLAAPEVAKTLTSACSADVGNENQSSLRMSPALSAHAWFDQEYPPLGALHYDFFTAYHDRAGVWGWAWGWGGSDNLPGRVANISEPTITFREK